MARSYGVLKTSMWEPGSEFRLLSPTAQWAYMLLLSQPQISNLGLLAFTPEKWIRLANGATPQQVEAAIGELEERRYLIVDRDTGELLVRTFIKHDRVWKMPKLVTNARVLFRTVESEAIRSYLSRRHPWLVEADWDKARIEAFEDDYQEPQEPPFDGPGKPLSIPLSIPVSEPLSIPVSEKTSGAQGLDTGPGVGPGSSSRKEEDQLQKDPAAAEQPSPEDLEAPRLSEVKAAVEALGDHDEQTLRQVEPLAIQVPRTVFLDVVARHERRVADGNIRNRSGLFVDLLRKAVKNYAEAVVRANLAVQLSPLEDVLNDCRSYAASSMPWDAAEHLVIRKLTRFGVPEDERLRILAEAQRNYLSVAA